MRMTRLATRDSTRALKALDVGGTPASYGTMQIARAGVPLHMLAFMRSKPPINVFLPSWRK